MRRPVYAESSWGVGWHLVKLTGTHSWTVARHYKLEQARIQSKYTQLYLVSPKQLKRGKIQLRVTLFLLINFHKVNILNIGSQYAKKNRFFPLHTGETEFLNVCK